MSASWNGRTTVVKLLLENGADVHAASTHWERKQWTALHHAAGGGHVDICSMFIDKEVDVNTQTEHGETALMLASGGGHTDVVKLLLDNKADVHAGRRTLWRKQWTALHLAADGDHVDICSMLINKHAHVNKQTENGETALMLASKKGHTNVVKLLLDNEADLHVVSSGQWNKQWTALHYAAAGGHVEICSILIDKDADINKQTEDEVTPLK